MKNYIFLFLAILFETIATSALKTSEQFSKPLPSVATIAGYILAFYFLGLTLKTIPVSIAYAIWSAVGIVLITLVGIVFFRQIPDLPAIIGLSLIIAGVIVIHVFSKTSIH
ncbi:multidrug transporter [Niabella ginsenosidivorans]|uniref:Multidrug transporter n=1 Tax=Niabella ginsenosidivorans TaxID=1176587 RepID=A0A1A9I0D8_9BACT|nr:multidrug efflux SMR transporter [Niabella ginsenosidivorans]ANH80539.1 multidrug transporter [Niabella ginsenosidivorans]